MASEKLFVHVYLDDGESRIVGIFERVLSSAGRATGSFGYAGSWLQRTDAFPLDPVNLPLVRTTAHTVKREGVFGVIADALPDRWGRRLISLDHPGLISPMRLLTMPGTDHVGCLAFSITPDLKPDEQVWTPQNVDTLPEIAEAFERIERREKVSQRMKALYRTGISIGGARPKTVVQDAGHLWIAKFQKHDDQWDQCFAEHAAMRLASLAGINVAHTRVERVDGRKVILVERFDRGVAPDYHPTAHFISALSLLGLSESDQNGSYADIASILRRCSSQFEDDASELFRRMVFNVLIGNRDDHLKNHAMIHTREGWRLSPAYDVLPQPDMEVIQAIAVGTMGGLPTIPNLLSRAADFGLKPDAAEAILDEVHEVVSGWRQVFRDEGADGHTIDRVAGAFQVGDAPSPLGGRPLSESAKSAKRGQR